MALNSKLWHVRTCALSSALPGRKGAAVNRLFMFSRCFRVYRAVLVSWPPACTCSSVLHSGVPHVQSQLTRWTFTQEGGRAVCPKHVLHPVQCVGGQHVEPYVLHGIKGEAMLADVIFSIALNQNHEHLLVPASATLCAELHDAAGMMNASVFTWRQCWHDAARTCLEWARSWKPRSSLGRGMQLQKAEEVSMHMHACMQARPSWCMQARPPTRIQAAPKAELVASSGTPHEQAAIGAAGLQGGYAPVAHVMLRTGTG